MNMVLNRVWEVSLFYFIINVSADARQVLTIMLRLSKEPILAAEWAC